MLRKLKIILKFGLFVFISFSSVVFFGARTVSADTIAPSVASVDTHYSSNWSGYVAADGSYTNVSGSWSVSPIIADSTTQRTGYATWVGIGGVTTHDLIQAGTFAMKQTSGEINYYGFYEILPATATLIPLDIHENDSISVSISEQKEDKWLIIVKNNTTGKQFKKIVTYDSKYSSAEWIQEMAYDGKTKTYVPLSDFKDLQFEDAETIKDDTNMSAKEAGAEPMSMISNAKKIIAAPSSLSSNGTDFLVKRTAATAVATVSASNTSTSNKRTLYRHRTVYIYRFR